LTVVASVEYYRQIKKAQKEYEKAKDVVEDIILSFNRELKREADRLELIAYKVEGSSAKADTSLKKVDVVEKKISPIENQISSVSHNNANILTGLAGLESKIKDIEDSQGTLKVKVAGFEEQLQKFSVVPETKSEPAILIRRDKAMAALTDTEIAVLEMLSAEGSKTAPEIKDRVHLSREHTARLMKKLYEEGYLEREVGKIPFRYSIKKEMEKLLKKTETSQQT
jgi:DNA-binding CsgD family transcriptional regulator